MLTDMNAADIEGDYRAHTLDLYGVGKRTVFVTDREVPYPDGRLIVSRTDPAGIITHCNASFVAMSGYSR
jgi:aerotaxis receptor